MVTRIGQKRRAHLYIREWMEVRGLSDETLGNRMGISRGTVYRRRVEQHRLNPDKIAEIAAALDLDPRELYRPPEHGPSLDAMVDEAPPELRQTVTDVVRRLVGKAS